jgi:hypothetical protein
MSEPRLTADYVISQLQPPASAADQYQHVRGESGLQSIRDHTSIVLEIEEVEGFKNFYVKPGPLSSSEKSMIQFILSYSIVTPCEIDLYGLFLGLILSGLIANGDCRISDIDETESLLKGLEQQYREEIAPNLGTYPVPWSEDEFTQLCLRIALESKGGMWFHTHSEEVANHYSMKEGGLFICM